MPAELPGAGTLRRIARRIGGPSPAQRPRDTVRPPVGERDWARYLPVDGPELTWTPPIEVDPGLAGDPRVTVLMPHLQLARMTGGPNTILNLTGRLARQGMRLRYASVVGGADEDLEPLRAHAELVAETPLPGDTVEFQAAGRGGGPLRLGPRDVLVATWWPTAHVARSALASLDATEFVYLVQDFEAGFYPWSTKHALARATLGFPIRAVVNESFLLEYLARERIGLFGGSAVDARSIAFEPAIDRSLFRPEPRAAAAPRRLLFYARPRNERNLFELGLRALREAARAGAFTPGRWEIRSIGSELPPLELGAGVTMTPTPWLPYPEYARLLRGSDLLLSLMLSPHTSYPPLEMAACGGIAITNSFGPKTPERLATLSPQIRGVEPDVAAIAGALVAAVREVEASGSRGGGQVTAPATWDEAFAAVLPWLRDTVREIGHWR